MKSYLQKLGVFIATIVLALGLSLTSARSADKPQTFTGKVSDAMCGAKHMNGTPADCTRACVKQGSKYALVVGDKVTPSKPAIRQLWIISTSWRARMPKSPAPRLAIPSRSARLPQLNDAFPQARALL